MKTVCILFIICFSTMCYSQNCYQTNLDFGIQKYNNKDYSEAIVNFTNAKKCSDSKGASVPNGWIAKSNAKKEEIERNKSDKAAYDTAIAKGTEASYRSYLSNFAEGKYKNEIKNKLNALLSARDLAEYNKAKSGNTEASYKKYLNTYPNGQWVNEATIKLKALVDQRDSGAFDGAQSKNTKEAYADYLKKYPEGNNAIRAKTRIKEIETKELKVYEKAIDDNTIESYTNYLATYPTTKYSSEISKKLKNVTFGKKFSIERGSYVNEVIETSTGELILIGGVTSSQNENVDKLELIKTTKHGKLIWRKKFSKGINTWGVSVSALENGDIVVLANFETNDKFGVWLLKLNSKGEKIWEKSLQGGKEDYATHLLQLDDGSFIVVGTTLTKGNGLEDAWVQKFRSDGTKLWEKTYGGTNSDLVASAIKTKDNALVLVGSTLSLGSKNSNDVWVIKINKDGNKIWEKAFGGNYEDEAFSVTEIAAGGIAVAGYTASPKKGKKDSWVIKLNNNGEKIWDKTYGYQGDYEAEAISETVNGNLIIANKTPSHGSLWFLKLNLNGKVISNKLISFKSPFHEMATILSLKDKSNIIGFSAALRTWSIWLLKLDANLELITKGTDISYLDTEELKNYREEHEVKDESVAWKDRYEDVRDLGAGLFRVEIDNKYGIVKTNGTTILPCSYSYDDFIPFTNYGILWVKSGDYYSLYTTDGNEIITKEQKIINSAFYDDLYDNQFGINLARVSNGKWGWINKNTGEIEIPLKYEAITAFKKGEAKVSLDGEKWFTINLKGECIKKCKNNY